MLLAASPIPPRDNLKWDSCRVHASWDSPEHLLPKAEPRVAGRPRKVMSKCRYGGTNHMVLVFFDVFPARGTDLWSMRCSFDFFWENHSLTTSAAYTSSNDG